MKGLPASAPINKYVSAWIVVTSVAATENYPITWRFTARLLCARGHPSTATAAIHLTGPDKFFTQPFFRARLVIPPRIACVYLTVASSPSFLCVHLFYFHFSRQWMSRWIIEMITRTSDGFKKKNIQKTTCQVAYSYSIHTNERNDTNYYFYFNLFIVGVLVVCRVFKKIHTMIWWFHWWSPFFSLWYPFISSFLCNCSYRIGVIFEWRFAWWGLFHYSAVYNIIKDTERCKRLNHPHHHHEEIQRNASVINEDSGERRSVNASQSFIYPFLFFFCFSQLIVL